uniref:Uncharacterized protein n=1 Tax=Vitis vinifera TaxID=29760 RepID=A5BKY0_VITVI|nr:hypothetical protein VITISV_042383 [Vitis vinifera]
MPGSTTTAINNMILAIRYRRRMSTPELSNNVLSPPPPPPPPLPPPPAPPVIMVFLIWRSNGEGGAEFFCSLRGTPGARGINIGAVCGNFFRLIQSLIKMATPSQSRSSGKGVEDNFEWRQAIERRQLASERQLKALLQETERLREENVALRIQASTSGPPRRQRLRGQVANSKPQQEPESIYPGITGAIPGACNVRPHEPRTPMPQAPREESSDSTHFSAKRQRDKKSQLSNSMRARLGPQEPGRSRPPMATTWAPRPDPIATPMVQNVHPHRDPVVTPVMRNVHLHPAV